MATNADISPAKGQNHIETGFSAQQKGAMILLLRKPPQTERIAVLMTCHNRRETTLNCLRALYGRKTPESVDFDVYLVDDGCTDGTGEAVRREHPEVTVLQGNGNLYWCGGMRLAWAEAAEENYDYYLWVNDDTLIYPDCVEKLLNVAKAKKAETSKSCIIIGSICDPETGEWSYGGRLRRNVGKDITGSPVFSAEVARKCDVINGNCVLLPRDVYKKIGNLSESFTHGLGDFDYGFKAVNAGFDIWVAPGFVGTCSKNPPAAWSSLKTPLLKRLKLLYSTKGLNLKEYITFCKRHTGISWIRYWFKAHLKAFFPQLWRFKK